MISMTAEAVGDDERVPLEAAPRVSIVIPAFNRSVYIRDTLESVLRQTMTEFEAIVIDDGSTDDTFDIVCDFSRRDPRVRAIRQQNAGCGAARNRGLAACSTESEYVIFLDSDDLWAPRALETLVRTADSRPDRSIFYSPWEWVGCIDAHGRVVPPVIPPGVTAPRLFSRIFRRTVTPEMCDDDPLPYMSAMCLFLSPGAVLVRKRVLDADPFDTSLTNNEDWDLWIRLARRNAICAVPGAIFYYRKHPGGKSNDWKRVARNRARIYRKLQRLPSISDAERGLYRRAAWRHYICQAAICGALFADALSRREYRTACIYAARMTRRYGNAAGLWLGSMLSWNGRAARQ